LIPIDSKFPIDTFKKIAKAVNKDEVAAIKKDFERDVKKHVDDIARKYILAEEKTVDYALMYIPSESVYYELINSETIFDYAGQNRVLPVSPMSFYAYIKAILISFEGEKIETKAKEILKILQAIKKDYQKTDEALSVLNKHVTNAYNQSSQVSKTFSSLGQKLESTNLLSTSEEKKVIE
jgi:DNA recombination protein RmuC